MRERRLRILLIDDDPDDRALARLVIAHELPQVEVEEITDAPAFAQACGRRSFDLVVLEQKLAWADGLAILAILKEDRPEMPVVLFTRFGNEEISLRAVRLGVDEYLVKKPASFLRLPLTVRAALDRARTRSAAGSAPLEALLDQGRVAVFSATPEGRLLNASPGFLRLLGAGSLEEAARLDLVPLISAAAGHASAQEVTVRRIDGRPVRVEVIGALARSADGVRVDGLVEDVTARKEAEEDLARRSAELRRANEDLQQFASIASHELQEPVRTMERYAGMLREDFEGRLSPGEEESIDLVVSAARRLRTLIEDLLAFSRAESRERRSVRVSAEELLDKAVANLEAAVEESGATITRAPLPVVEADPGQIVQLFQNLLGNALKFHGGEPPRIHVAAERRGGELVFSVRDHGTGVAPEDAETIFLLFRRVHPEIPGSGIGLALCKRIVERHGGRIWVEPAPDRGAVFFFALPAPEDPVR